MVHSIGIYALGYMIAGCHRKRPDIALMRPDIGNAYLQGKKGHKNIDIECHRLDNKKTSRHCSAC